MRSRVEQDGRETAASIEDGRTGDIVDGTIADVASDGIVIIATADFHGGNAAGWSVCDIGTISLERVTIVMGITAAVNAGDLGKERTGIDATPVATGATGR